MRKRKDFDAVEMKRAIQEKTDAEYAGMTADEARAAQRRRIEEDPELGPFLRQVRLIHDRAAPDRD
jgi:hypothetical protein